MDMHENEWQKATKGRIRMEIGSFLGEHRGDVISYNEESSISDDEALLVLAHVAKTCEIEALMPGNKPDHGWDITALVGFIYENQRPRSVQPTSP